MKCLNIFFVITFFLCINDIYGNEKECLTTFKNCITNLIGETREKTIEKFCCRQAFVGNEFREKLQKNCLTDRIMPDVVDCLGIDKKCIKTLTDYFRERTENYTKMEKDLRIAARQPNSIEDCEDYAKRFEQEECSMCSDKDDDDELYGVICDIIRKTKKSLPYCVNKHHCMDTFNTCIMKKINESMVHKVDVRCCKSALNNKSSDYFKNKDKCESPEFMPTIIDCMFKDEYCKVQIFKYFTKNGEILEEFRTKINSETGIPPETSQCDKYYSKSKTISLIECYKTTNKKLFPFCQLLIDILNKEPINDINDDLYNYANDNFDNRLKK
ncbi:uncharacterized protein LOC111636258 [Centruroides sculpturatus]|uniref:uncharacterized protein LOC111636258 n=1 Tax=Centruroides sculpturatus TaxID=218467 RepID=UPI000C6E0D0D|nr:uncharacterized protein LOC111636258 [Centruroides sculpturatus]